MTTETILSVARRAREAALSLAALPTRNKNQALLSVAAALRAQAKELLAANLLDVAVAQIAVNQGEMTPATLARLRLDESKLNLLIEGVEEVAALADPVGRILKTTQLDEGLTLKKVSCPLGVLLVIFEARPDVVVQIASLAIKSANAVILKGGKEAVHTNQKMADVIVSALAGVEHFPLSAVQLVHTREEVAELLKQDSLIDLVIPRGGRNLIAYVATHTAIPILGHADGVCHIYVAPSADIALAKRVCVDAKTQYPSACNAVETLLIDSRWPQENQKNLLTALEQAGVTLRGGTEIAALTAHPVAEVASWHTEYGDAVLSVRLVDGFPSAVRHIHTYGSKHTECILTQDNAEAEAFLNQVDAAGVYHNASTRFADGYRYGFGAEVGISTAKTHARGPVGLEGLTLYKYKLYGSGQIVADYTGPHAKKFTHKDVAEAE